MSLGLILSVLFAAQAAPEAAAAQTGIGISDAAYDELAEGRVEEAIAHLEAALDRKPGDPSLLINLGSAYARAGRTDEARAMFRSAVAADERYRLELADGSWVDSRQAARQALDSLETSSAAFASK